MYLSILRTHPECSTKSDLLTHGDVCLIHTVYNCSVSDCHSNAIAAVLFCTGETGILIIQGASKIMSDSKFNLKSVSGGLTLLCKFIMSFP